MQITVYEFIKELIEYEQEKLKLVKDDSKEEKGIENE